MRSSKLNTNPIIKTNSVSFTHCVNYIYLLALQKTNAMNRNRADKRPAQYEPNHESRNTSKGKGHRGAKGKGSVGRSSMPSQKGKGKSKRKGNAKGKSKGMYLIHSILIPHLEYVIVQSHSFCHRERSRSRETYDGFF